MGSPPPLGHPPFRCPVLKDSGLEFYYKDGQTVLDVYHSSALSGSRLLLDSSATFYTRRKDSSLL